MGLVGESGCGKSTLARILAFLWEPTSGEVFYKGEEVRTLRKEKLLAFRRAAQMVFQDTSASLNPRHTIAEAISEPLIIHRMSRGQALRAQLEELLEEVGLDPSLGGRLPASLSGGQRQRVAIARALALRPELLICDEPVSSLDLSVQAQILSLLEKLQTSRGLTLFIISHNLATLSSICDRILVMHQGRIVEEGKNPDLFLHPRHPATSTLVNLAVSKL